MVTGLIDQNLTQAMLNTVKDLSTLLNYVTAEESTKTNVVTSTAAAALKDIRDSSSGPVTTLPLAHYVYDRQLKAWKAQSPKPAPTLTVSIRVDKAAYGQLKLNPPRLNKRASAGQARGRRATTDTGAQLTIINISELHALHWRQS